MPPNERVAKLLLRIQTEKAAIDKSKQDLRAFQREFTQFKAESEKTNRALEQQARGLQAQQRAALQASRETDRLSKEQRELAQDVERTTQALGKQAGAGGGRNLLQRVGSELKALPSQQLPGGLSTDVIGKLTNTLGGLGVAGTAAAAGIGAAVVALKASTAGIEQTVKAIIASQEAYYRALKTGTRESIQAAIDAQKIEIEITRGRVQEYQTLFRNLEAQIGTIGRGVADALDAGGARQLREETQRLEQELRDLEFGLGRMEQALESTEVATRSAEEAEKALADARQSVADQRIKTQLQAELQAVKLSAAAIQERIASINREQQAIFQIVKAGEASVALSNELTQRQRDLTTELMVLVEALPTAQAREKIQSFVDGLLNIPKTVGQVTNAIEALQKASADIANLKAEFFARTKEITDREQDALNKAIAERDRAVQEAEQRAADQRADLRFDEQTAELRHLQVIMRIRRSANRDIDRAIADRSAVALEEARQNKKDQLADQKEQYSNEQRELKRRNEVINRELKQATAQIRARYIEQTNEAKAAAIRALTIEQQKFAKELEIKTAAYQKLLTADQTAAANVINVHANYWQNALVLAQRAVTAISQANTTAAQVKRFGNPGGSTNRLPSLDTGGMVTRTGIALVHQNELVINPKRGQSAGNIQITITAANRRELHRQIDRKLDDFVVTSF